MKATRKTIAALKELRTFAYDNHIEHTLTTDFDIQLDALEKQVPIDEFKAMHVAACDAAGGGHPNDSLYETQFSELLQMYAPNGIRFIHEPTERALLEACRVQLQDRFDTACTEQTARMRLSSLLGTLHERLNPNEPPLTAS